MKLKYNSVLDISKPMLYIVTMCGVIMPDFESRLIWPKVTIKFFKIIGKISCFLLVFFFFVNVYSVAAAGDDTSFQEKIYFVVVAVNAFCCFNRVLAILANHDAVIGFLNQFNRNFKNKMHSTFRQKLIQNRTKIINIVAVSYITVQVSFTYLMEFYSGIKFGREVHPNNLPGNHDHWAMITFNLAMEIIIGTCYIVSMTSFEWVLLVYVRLTTIELEVVRKQVNAIFSTVVWSEKHGICVTTQNIQYGLEGVEINDKKIEDDDLGKRSLTPIYSQEGLENYTRVVTISEKYLNEIILHHSRLFKEHSGAKTAFGVQMVMTYLNTVFLSISWILAERKPDDSPDGNAFLLPPFSIMAFTMLAYLSYFGEELLKAGLDVTHDVVGLDWYLYPTSMKKKLVIFLAMCQKPLVLDAYGQGPLCYESFKMSCQCCYSLFTFLRGSS